ncbi:MAG TPA: S24 family peptidase [Thermoanaerobaculia bacterium]|nr:S24 family peptidase [Thermoanaerobaculia bacterium]
MTDPAPGGVPLRTLNAEELLAVASLWKRTGREFVTRFRGVSMQPAIPDSAAVRLRCADDVDLGDVVAYAVGQQVIVHRIVARWNDRFLTRGDGNVLPDAILPERNGVIGKVTAVELEGDWNPPGHPPSSLAGALLLRICSLVAAVAGPRVAGRLLRILHRVRQSVRGPRGSSAER